jgi:DNA polymerase delta subunit 2
MHAFRRKLLVDFLYGIGTHPDRSEMATFSASIGRVIICGGLLHMPLSLDHGEWKKPLSSDVTAKDLAATMNEVDEFLSLIGGAVACDVIPSREDPTNLSLPQQRINPRLVPRSEAVGSVHFGTNPFHATLGKELEILGTSGDNVRNVRRYTKIVSSAMPVEGESSGEEGTSDEIEIMRRMLAEWRHIAPVAPDTLGCFPFSGNDPLVIERCPHVFFAGGASRFDTAVIDTESPIGIRLISVPSFAETGVVALLNLKDLSCIPFKICSV